jgi:hypothetical protein
MSSQTKQNEASALLALLRKELATKTLERSQLEETLSKLKVLGRNANNVSALYNQDGIETIGKFAFGDFSPTIAQEALRCLANALLLLPSTRHYSLKCSLDRKASESLRDATIEEEFLLSRILLLLTYDPSIQMNTLVADHGLAESITKNLSRHADQATDSRPKSPVDPEAMAFIETLKLLFNATSIDTRHVAKFKPALIEILRIFKHVEIPSPPLQPPVNVLINALANLDIDSEQMEASEAGSAVTKLISVLKKAAHAYSSTELDTIAIPLLTALRKMNEAAPPTVRDVMKASLLPADEERDQPIGKSSSLASQLLRLTTSSGMIKLSESISGLMFELSDKDASEYVKNVGYGYAAGYLMTHKIPIPESARKSEGEEGSSGHVPVNPITGQRLDREPAVELPEMTREEKEQEAERLFVLFERLKATGVVDVKNPVDVARDQGRLEELSDSDPDE